MEAFEYNLTKFAEQLSAHTGGTIDESRSIILQGMLFYNIAMEQVISRITRLG